MSNVDLTVGEPERVVFRFCLPLFGSIIFQQLYNLADSFVAGKFVSEDALAAVGNSYELTLIFIAFAFGCNIGCSVVSAQLYGARRFRDLKTAVTTTLIACGVLCLILMSGGFLLGDRLLEMINTPADVFTASKVYLDIYILGLPFVLFYNVATGIFSALGDSKTPFIFLMCSSVANIAVDILFTTALSPLFKYGVDGVAWATFICQGISCILALIFVRKRFRMTGSVEKAPVFSFEIFKKIAGIAVPTILQQSFISVGNIVIQSFINTFDTGVMAGYAAAVKLNNLVITSFTTIGNGISSFTAQNLGAQKHSRIPDGFRAGITLVWTISLPIVALYLLLGRPLVGIFLKEPSEIALKSGAEYLRVLSPFYFVVSAKLIADGVLRGAAMMKKFMASTFTDLLLRVLIAGILSKTALGYLGIWLAWPIGWVIATGISLAFYRSGKWKARRDDT